MAGVNKTVFVTVGSTKFDKFTEVLVTPGVLKVLKSRGYTRLKIQYGNGSFIPPDCSLEGVQISSYRFKDSLQQDMSSADLILSHAGAGTCLEALGLGKKLVVVVNEDLHDNHQVELAQKFAELGYLLYCTCGTLFKTLQKMNLNGLNDYVPGNPQLFADFLTKAMISDSEISIDVNNLVMGK